MAQRLFTKSAFKTALHCPMRAYYSRNDEYAFHPPFPAGQAEIGNQFGELARLYEGVPEENVIKSLGYDESLSLTAELLAREDADIAEAAFRWENCFVRVDILHKRGNRIELIEVKSKTVDGNTSLLKKDGEIDTDLEDYVYDIAFQKYVVANAVRAQFPEAGFSVTARLMFVDTSVVSPVALSPLFKIISDGKRSGIECVPGAAQKVSACGKRICRMFDVDGLCDRIAADDLDGPWGKVGSRPLPFTQFVEKYAGLYVRNVQDFSECHISSDCFTCPYRKTAADAGGLKDGFAACFGHRFSLPEPAFSAQTIGNLKGKTKSLKPKELQSSWQEKKIIFISQLDETAYAAPEGFTEQALLSRTGPLTGDDLRFLHIRAVKTGSTQPVFLRAAAKAEMAKWKYPLHFIDFETYLGALPLFADTRANEMICYQFSHHTVSADGTVTHAGEFISLEPGQFPNFAFIRALKAELEHDDGSVFRYAAHENSCLNAVRDQLWDSAEPDKDELIAFIESITHPTGSTAHPFKAGSRDMLDQKTITEGLFWHPAMGGSNSIKQVLPAVLQSIPYFSRKYGNDMDPYHTLPTVGEQTEAVLSDWSKQTGKTREELLAEQADDSDVYDADLRINAGGISKLDYINLHGGRFNALHAEAIRRAALKYCELDTRAMVRIWEYFAHECGEIKGIHERRSKNMAEADDYAKFKQLLEYFVAHLEYCQNDCVPTERFERYVKPFIGEGFVKEGLRNGDALQRQVAPLTHFDGFTVNVTIRNSFGDYSARTSFIYWDTINVCAFWRQDKKAVYALEIYKATVNAQGHLESTATVLKETLSDLGLFDDNAPNGTLQGFFNNYASLIALAQGARQ